MKEIQDTITNSPEGRYTCSSTGVRRLTMSTCDENVKKKSFRQNFIVKNIDFALVILKLGLYFTFEYDVTK